MDSPKKQIFEMPTGGAAIKLARKEQCLALGTRLRSKVQDQVPILQGVSQWGSSLIPYGIDTLSIDTVFFIYPI